MAVRAARHPSPAVRRTAMEPYVLPHPPAHPDGTTAVHLVLQTEEVGAGDLTRS